MPTVKTKMLTDVAIKSINKDLEDRIESLKNTALDNANLSGKEIYNIKENLNLLQRDLAINEIEDEKKYISLERVCKHLSERIEEIKFKTLTKFYISLSLNIINLVLIFILLLK